MKSFSLAGRSLMSLGLAAVIMGAMPAGAAEMVTGAELKDHVKSVLSSRGLDSDPMISDNRQFRACDAPFEVAPMFGGYKTVRLSCPDAAGFEIAVRTQIDKNLSAEMPAQPEPKAKQDLAPVVVLTKSIQRGEIITADALKIVRHDKNPGAGYFRDQNDVIGRRAKRSLSINQTVRSRHLELDYAIQKDQSVIIESKIGPVTVLSAGIAIADAQIGELVKVKNTSSALVVEGIVMSEKKIRIRAK